ncbi:MAG: DMT family transporter [Pikeienuella sp.]
MTTPAIASDRPLFGALMIISGMIMIGIIDNCVRIIAGHVGLWQFHFIRSCLAIPMILMVATVSGWRWWPHRMSGAMIRSAFIVTSMLLYFGSLPMAPIAQVAAGLLTAPIWVLLISATVFRAPIGPRRIVAVGVGFLGALLILRPWTEAFSLWSLIPLAAGAAYAGASISTRRLCADEPPMALILLFFTGLGIAGAIGMAVLAIWPQPELTMAAPFFFEGVRWPIPGEGWFWITVQAAGSILCVYCVTRGYQSAETSSLALFDFTFLISASLTGWLVWGDTVDAMTALGGALIIGAGAFIALRGARD